MAKTPIRLPVVQSPQSDPGAVTPRSAGQWVLVGAGLILTLWMPLIVVALWVAQKWVAWSARHAASTVEGQSIEGQLDAWWIVLAGAGPLALSFVVACIAGGAIIGRFGSTAGPRQAMLAGGSAAAFAWSLTLLSGNLGEPVVAAASAAALGAFGTVSSRIGFGWSRRR
jgi:hypothetical protein